MATPFPFVSGAVLTAAQLNSISELPTRTITTNDNAAAADSYKRVILNGTSITYTINTSTFSAGQVVEIYNANSTAATIAAGAGVTLNGAAGLTLAQYQTAELYAVSATSFVLWKSDVTQTNAGLVYLTGAAFTTATSFSLPNSTFTSTYRNYRIIIMVNALTTDSDFTMRLRASGSDDSNSQYRNIWFGYTSLSATDSVVTVPGSAFSMREGDTAASVIYSLVLDVIQPQVATATAIHGQVIFLNKAGAAYVSSMVNGLFTATTQFDALSFISSVASSMTGVYRVYGYADS